MTGCWECRTASTPVRWRRSLVRDAADDSSDQRGRRSQCRREDVRDGCAATSRRGRRHGATEKRGAAVSRRSPWEARRPCAGRPPDRRWSTRAPPRARVAWGPDPARRRGRSPRSYGLGPRAGRGPGRRDARARVSRHGDHARDPDPDQRCQRAAPPVASRRRRLRIVRKRASAKLQVGAATERRNADCERRSDLKRPDLFHGAFKGVRPLERLEHVSAR